MSVTWFPLSSGQHNLRVHTHIHIGSSWKGRAIRSSIFPHNQGFTKGRKGARRRWRVILMNIWQRFFPLYPPVDSLSDSYKTHPSLMSVRLSLNWLEISSPFIDLEKQTRIFHHFTNLKSEFFNFRWSLIFFYAQTQRRYKWKKSERKKGRCSNYLSFLKNPPVKLTSSKDSGAEKPDSTLRLTSLFSLCHFYLSVHMLFSVHLSTLRASPWQERSLSTTAPANQIDVSHHSSDI